MGTHGSLEVEADDEMFRPCTAAEIAEAKSDYEDPGR